MRFRILPKILLVAGVALLLLTVRYQDQIQDFFSFNMEKLKIHVDNYFYLSSAQAKRKRPISLIKKETELKLYIGEPFKSFSMQDWNKFWLLIYGAYPKEPPPRAGLPMKMRQLTQDEIADELTVLYPEPFASFQDKHWQLFFDDIVFKK